MNRRNLLSSLLVFLMPIFLVGQSVVGVVSGEGKPLVGANVVIEGTGLGTILTSCVFTTTLGGQPSKLYGYI